MKTMLAFAFASLASLVVPEVSAGQTTLAQVTAKVPVNLTQFGPDVAKVRVACELYSPALTNGTGRSLTGSGVNPQRYLVVDQEVPVSGGQLNTSVSIVFSAQLDNPVGQSATVSCQLDGWSTSTQSWTWFQPTAANPSFKVSSGIVGQVNSTFTW